MRRLRFFLMSLCIGVIVTLVAESDSFSEKSPPLLEPTDPSGIDGDAASEKKIQSVNLFSPDGRPGTGVLEFAIGEKKEKIEFGSKTGLYGIALAFSSSDLPETFQNEFPDMRLIQVTLGTLNSHIESQIRQFSTITLVSKAIPKQAKTFQISSPQQKPKTIDGKAFMLFTSPLTPKDRKDEEKLSGMYVGQTGTIQLSPKGDAEEVTVAAESENLNFMSQEVALEFECLVGTPFNPQKGSLKGSISIAMLWPRGKRSELFAQRISMKAIQAMKDAPAPGVIPK